MKVYQLQIIHGRATYTSSIENSSSCSAEIKIYESNYTEPSTEHFYLTVGDGQSTNEGTFSVRVLPSTSLPPQIILETFPEKTIYTAGEKLDIEAWQSYSYNDKPLLFSWTPLNQESRRISKTLRSRFQGIQRDTLEVSVPNPLGTTNTITKSFQYQLTVTERNADNTLGLSSSEIVNIEAAQVCPISPVIRSLEASQLTYRQGTGMNILELEADFGARCQTADGQDHPLQITWTYDSSIFTPTTTAVSDSIILTLDLDSVGDEPLKKDIIFSVRDTLNSSTVVETVSIDILPELICELAFSFPGNEANSSDVYNLTPERSHILASKIDCSIPEGNYTTKSSKVRVFKYSASISDSGVVTQINNDDQLIYSYDKGTSKPAFEFVTAVFFAGEEQSGFKITVDDFENQNAPLNPIYANVQYKSLIPSATIVQRHDNFGAIKPINSMEYEEKTTASVLNFILDASRSKNPNTTPGALSYNWAVVGDSSNLSLASNNTTATAIVSGLAPFESKEWTIRMTISDQSAKAKSTSTDLKIKIEQDNSLPILTNLQIPGRNIYNNVSVTFDLYDLEGEHSSIQFEYSTDGAEWLTSAATV